jgi:hypothetical protein
MIGVLGFYSRLGLGIFLLTTASRTALGPTQPPIQWIPGALSLGVKLTTHFRLMPRSRMRGAISPLHLYVFMAWWLVTHRDNFTFTYTFIRRYVRYQKTVMLNWWQILLYVARHMKAIFRRITVSKRVLVRCGGGDKNNNWLLYQISFVSFNSWDTYRKVMKILFLKFYKTLTWIWNDT